MNLSSPARWNTRAVEKKRRLEQVAGLARGAVLPAEHATEALQKLLMPGDRVVLEGNNQKQADFLARALAAADPGALHDLHMIMPSVSLPSTWISSSAALRAAWIFPSPGPRACASRSCCRTAGSRSAPSTPTPSCMPGCTST